MPSSCAFRRAFRLTRAEEFKAVFDYRCSAGQQWFQVLARPNGTTEARLGLVVGRKTERRAVRRNFIKRRIRETFRVMRSDLQGLDLIVRTRQPFFHDEAKGAVTALKKLFQKVKRCQPS